MHFITVPLYEAEVDSKSVRINPHHIVFYKDHFDDGALIRLSTDVNIYAKLSVLEVDALVDRAL